MASLVGPDHVWDEATRPEVARIVEAFEAAWRGGSGRKPSVDSFLRAEAHQHAGARLALLRADMALRWEGGDRVRVESYAKQSPALSDDQLVALAYEELCLREDYGEHPLVSEYYERFPQLLDRLRRLFDIHDLVGTGSSTALSAPLSDSDDAGFPEVGETIGGFLLVEELGRGAFARVYRAAERRLANRPVALKLALHGSREPQMLARLQHTHIVPIHSFRTDPSTGLHMLCMPYFGKVTLSRLLEQDDMRKAVNGADILNVLSRLEPESTKSPDTAPSALRARFASLPYSRAISLWGAQLADGLNYAHEHRLVHGDIKPSNVLITPDSSPMLLDFNLAQSVPEGQTAAREAFGGTFPYMAPEHLEALAGGQEAMVDARSDIFSLGVVLYEAMGARPFDRKPTLGSHDFSTALRQAAQQRRRPAPRLRDTFPEVSPAFEAVVSKCLAPEIEERYETAAALAEDLQAVADDGPLRHAREPQPYRVLRWVRRNRVRLAVLMPAACAVAIIGSTWVWSHFNLKWVESQVRDLITNGKSAEQEGQPGEALRFFAAAEQMAEKHAELAYLGAVARERQHLAREAQSIREKVDNLFRDSGALRFALLGFETSDPSPVRTISQRLKPFSVFQMPDWRKLPELSFLKPKQADEVVQEVDELLFFWAVATVAHPLATPDLLEEVSQVCKKALAFSQSSGPWKALLECSLARREGRPLQAVEEPSPASEGSAWTCFQWGLIHTQIDRNRSNRALRWLDRSVRLDPKQYWGQYLLAYRYDLEGHSDRALAHFNAAIALDPNSPWALFSRARLAWPRGDWEQAKLDLEHAVQLAETNKFTFPQAHLERGLVNQRLGDFNIARSEYDYVLRVISADSPLGRSARLNRALLETEQGHERQALEEYTALLADKIPTEERAAILAARTRLLCAKGDSEGAQADLETLMQLLPENAEILALKAWFYLQHGRPHDALDLARQAAALETNPALDRLCNRAALAAGRLELLRCDDPAEIEMWPGQRHALNQDLARAVAAEYDPALPTLDSLLTRAVLLAARSDSEALRVVELAVARAPHLVRARVIEARVRNTLRDRAGARAAVEAGLALEPDDSRLLELLGLMKLAEGNTGDAIVTLDRASLAGVTPTLHVSRARAFEQAKNWRSCFLEWTEQIKRDMENAQYYIERAAVARRLGLVDQSLADLETAINRADRIRPDLYESIVREYASCLVERPSRVGRVVSLASRSLARLSTACP
jgi:serine/threonine protein kinase/Tfp pilus assembly protein PilF